MEIKFSYFLSQEEIQKNKDRFNLKTMSEQAMLDVFAVSRITIRNLPSLECLAFEGELIGFITYVRGALVGFEKGLKDRVGALSIEQLYSFEFLKSTEELIIIDHYDDYKTYHYDYKKFKSSFLSFYSRVISDLQKIYPELLANQNFKNHIALSHLPLVSNN